MCIPLSCDMEQVAEIAILCENIGQRIATEYGQKRTKRLVQNAGQTAGRCNDAFPAFDQIEVVLGVADQFADIDVFGGQGQANAA